MLPAVNGLQVLFFFFDEKDIVSVDQLPSDAYGGFIEGVKVCRQAA